MEVMLRLDSVKSGLETEKTEHKEDVKNLNAKINSLTIENQVLRNDNERLKSILNNDSSNTSRPPSTDRKGSRPSNFVRIAPLALIGAIAGVCMTRKKV